MPLPAPPSLASLPLRVSRGETETPTQETRTLNAALTPEHSLLICGRSRTVTTTSTLQWVAGPPQNPHLRNTVFDLAAFPDSPITLLHYMAPKDAPAGALPPPHLHQALNLTESKSGFLFVHDASDGDVDESMLCLRRYIELFHRHGGRGFWVVINTAGSIEKAGLMDVDSVAARFAEEFIKWPELDVFSRLEPGPRVLKMPIEAAYCVIGDAMLKAPRFFAPRRNAHPVATTPGALCDQDFRSVFLNGHIVPWKHEDYVRAAYLTLVDPENRDLGLLDIATKFAADVNAFKQRNSQIQLLPESRTLTVFWLYHVELARVSMRVHERRFDDERAPDLVCSYRVIFNHIPQLRDQKLPTAYFSLDILKSEYAERFWMLPDIRVLVEPRRERNDSFKQEFAKSVQEDPERLLRFVFAVVQRYLRPGETRRRSWFIHLAFAAFQTHTTRLRSKQPWISVYSETQAYFYLQLVHAALSQLRAAGRNEFVQEMSYPLFRKMFNIAPSAWVAYYTKQHWNSLQARAGFLPPDIKPLPDTIQPSAATQGPASSSADPNLPFRGLGLVPELPSLETLHFHQAILLEDAKAIKTTLKPTDVTTHAALLKYIHTHIIVPSLSAPPASIPPLIRQHLTLLSHASLLPTTHLTTVLTLTLHHLATRSNPDYFPPTPPRPSYHLPVGALNPHGTRYRRVHNCPCHDGLPLPYDVGPDAVSYPLSFPYKHPLQRTHGCECHREVAVDQDAFAALCAPGFEEYEVGEKRRRGEVYPGRDQIDVGDGWVKGEWEKRVKGEWEGWVRGSWGLVVCWEGVGKLEVGWLKGLGDWQSEGEKAVEEEQEDNKATGGDGDKEKEGREQETTKESKEEEDDDKTLAGAETEDGEAGGGGGDGDEWEVVSQHTLC